MLWEAVEAGLGVADYIGLSIAGVILLFVLIVASSC